MAGEGGQWEPLEPWELWVSPSATGLDCPFGPDKPRQDSGRVGMGHGANLVGARSGQCFNAPTYHRRAQARQATQTGPTLTNKLRDPGGAVDANSGYCLQHLSRKPRVQLSKLPNTLQQ